MEILVTICARGGSKGIPGKNIRLLAGKPLINYTVDMAERIGELLNADIILSTDDNRIKNAVVSAKVYKGYDRPDALATDGAGKISAIIDVLHYAEVKFGKTYDFILDLDVTSPLRTIKDLTTSFQQIRSDNEALTLFSVSNANRNPYFNMVEDRGDGYVKLVKTLSSTPFLSRQSAPGVYDINGSFYWYKRPYFDTGLLTPITEKTLIYVMDHICFDLDHPIDFDFLEYLVKENKLDFSM